MKKLEYYFDYTKEAYDYIMASKILRNRDKCILKDLVDGKKNKRNSNRQQLFLSNNMHQKKRNI